MLRVKGVLGWLPRMGRRSFWILGSIAIVAAFAVFWVDLGYGLVLVGLLNFLFLPLAMMRIKDTGRHPAWPLVPFSLSLSLWWLTNHSPTAASARPAIEAGEVASLPLWFNLAVIALSLAILGMQAFVAWLLARPGRPRQA